MLALAACFALIAVFVVIKKTKDIKWGIYFYVLNHLVINFIHFIINNGKLEMQGILFFLLIVLFGFLMINRIWGFALLFFILTLYFVGLYNTTTGFSLFCLQAKYADIVDPSVTPYFTVIPLLLNVFLISQFEKAKQKAEQQIKEQKIQLEHVNAEMAEQKQDIVSSINYAQKIQYAVLPHEETIYRSIPLAFILYKPKDIVSGDYFWFHEIDSDNYILVCGDCTGHGVPGAFMTVIGSNLLNQIVIDNKIYQPSEILHKMDELLNMTLKQDKDRSRGVQDGMDLSLLRVNKTAKEIIITSAKRPVVFIRDKQMQDLKGSKFSLGGMRSGEKVFEEIKINYKEDDMLYFFTDGYTDQFGGAKGKKFSSKRLKDLFFDIHQSTIPAQKQTLDLEIEKWRGSLEQVDDICVIGIRF